MINIYHIGEL